MLAESQPTLQKVLRLDVDEDRYHSLKNRGILFLDDKVEEMSCAHFIRDIFFLATGGSLSENLPPVGEIVQKKRPIWIVLNSPGGDIYFGFAIYDSIELVTQSGIEVDVLGMGEVSSMASVIMQAGTKRLATVHTQFLLHQLQELPSREKREVNIARETSEELDRVNKVLMGIIAKRVGMKLEDLMAQTYKKDFWLDCDAARKLGTKGLIDDVIIKLPF